MYHVTERNLHVDTVVTENTISDQVFCDIAHESHGFWNEWVISYNFLFKIIAGTRIAFVYLAIDHVKPR